MFEISRDTCTVDGYSVKGKRWDYLWGALNFEGKEWRETSTLMDAIVGRENAPPDPHWRVPHKTQGTFHRVRLKRRKAST